ncbi:Nitroreductase [uncultured Desulfobacterium sp.]|uniref:Nitroreductase n=1 Tax=uncultured Desulfobacterium sp. TaxID=201089 RepID=A0A445MS23_9BACT|nr:Nitroreductase [uncultured Desulfobacterium sp.]
MLEKIRSRRSIRKFTVDDVDEKTVDLIIEMGTWAPSGINNQPWRFVIVRDQHIRNEISTQTRYSKIIQNAPVCIAVFLDHSRSYNYIKDVQAIGACLQNMLLTIHHLGLGGVWLGEILKNRQEVEKILGVPEGMELMAVIALGHTTEKSGQGNRRPLSEVILAHK